jgi:hypothetical protein
MATTAKTAKTAKSTTAKTAKSTNTKQPQAKPKASTKAKSSKVPFEIDPELLGPEYNQVRRPSLPYGFILNDNPAGIFIPLDQLEEAEWKEMPDEDSLVTASPSGKDIEGLLISDARFLIIAATPEYIRYKRDEELEERSGTIIGLYNDYRGSFDKKTMDACADHALVFLNEENRPLHGIPVSIRFKNVALWSFASIRDKFYRGLERAFAEYANVKFSNKSDQWRSLGVLEIAFKAEKQGTNKNKSWCCKTESITPVTAANLPEYFLGRPDEKRLIWGLNDSIAGYAELLALPSSAKSTVEVVDPQGPSPKKSAKVKAKNEEDFTFDDDTEDDTELDDDELDSLVDEETDDDDELFDDDDEDESDDDESDDEDEDEDE